MHAFCQLLGQAFVDCAMALNRCLPLEPLAYKDNLEVCLPSSAVLLHGSMARMLMALINDFHMLHWLKLHIQFALDFGRY